MKAYLISLAAAFLIIIFVVQAQTTTVQTNETLAKKSGCFKCHAKPDGDNKKAIGPAFRDVAMKYKNNPLSRDSLVETVKNGGKGHWTKISRGVPMPPYSGRLTDEQIRSLVAWVLSHNE